MLEISYAGGPKGFPRGPSGLARCLRALRVAPRGAGGQNDPLKPKETLFFYMKC